MKKIATIILAITISIFTFTSCNAESDQERTDYNTLLNENRSDVLSSLEISEDDIEELNNGMILLPNSENVLGYDFSTILMFDSENNLYGHMYYIAFVDDSEKAISTFEDVISKLTDENGEPDTYPNHPDQFSTTNDVTEKLQQDLSKVIESWNLEQEENLVLEASLENIGENTLTLLIKYNIQISP